MVEPKPEHKELSEKFVWNQDDSDGLHIDNSQAEGEPIDFTPVE